MTKQSAYFSLDDALSGHNAKELKQSVSSIPGVLSVTVGDSREIVSVDYDSTGTDPGKIEAAIRSLHDGVCLKKVKEHLM